MQPERNEKKNMKSAQYICAIIRERRPSIISIEASCTVSSLPVVSFGQVGLVHGIIYNTPVHNNILPYIRLVITYISQRSNNTL